MGIISKIFKRRRKVLVDDLEEQVLGNVVLKRTDLEMTDDFQREKYVKNCLEQLNESSNELDKVTFEYNLVTSYLKDMEEIEALPDIERRTLNECADRIVKIDKSRKSYTGKKIELQINNSIIWNYLKKKCQKLMKN